MLFSHGVAGGSFAGFIYFKDIVALAFADRYSISYVANVDVSEIGFASMFSLSASCYRFKSDNLTAVDCASLYFERNADDETHATFWSLLAWYATESVLCRWYVSFADSKMNAVSTLRLRPLFRGFCFSERLF